MARYILMGDFAWMTRSVRKGVLMDLTRSLPLVIWFVMTRFPLLVVSFSPGLLSRGRSLTRYRWVDVMLLVDPFSFSGCLWENDSFLQYGCLRLPNSFILFGCLLSSDSFNLSGYLVSNDSFNVSGCFKSTDSFVVLGCLSRYNSVSVKGYLIACDSFHSTGCL